MEFSQSGGSFYTRAESEVLIDPFTTPFTMQTQLASELSRCEDLVRRDFRYAHLVAGASKMPIGAIWVARNQGGDVDDCDLASLRDVAWTEFVKKRFLPSVAEGTPVDQAAASMLEIVRSMNLQRRRFQIMGLHEQVEASELQFVIHLCQAGLLHTSEYRITANRFRRHDKFFEAFALAVGAFVCSSAPFTLGVATTQYNRDLQYEYKKQNIALFVYVLQQNRGFVSQGGLDEDYVSRISRLIIVSQEQDGAVAGHRDNDDGDDGGGGNRRRKKNESETTSSSFIRGALDRIQRQSDRVERLADQFETKVNAMKEEKRDSARGARGGDVSETVTHRINEMMESNRRHTEIMNKRHEEQEKEFNRKIQGVREEVERSIRTTHESSQGLNHRIQDIKTEILSDVDLHKRQTNASLDSVKSEMGIQEVRIDTLNLSESKRTQDLDYKFKVLNDILMRQNEQTRGELITRFNVFTDEHSRAVKGSVDEGGPAAAGGISMDETVRQQISDSITQSVLSFVKSTLDDQTNRLKDQVIHEVVPAVMQQLHQHMESSIRGFLPGINEAIQCAESIRSLSEQLGKVTSRISSSESMLHAFQQNVSAMETAFSHMYQLAHKNDLDALSEKILILEQSFLAMDDAIDTQKHDIIEEVINLRNIDQKIKSEDANTKELTSEIANMEHRITDQIRRHVEEKMKRANAAPPPLLLTDEDTINAIAQKVIQSTRFNASVNSMVLGGLRNHEYDLPSRVHTLEQYMASKTQTAPAFNVFSAGDGSAGAMYTTDPAAAARR